MTYTNADARARLLEDVASATDQIGTALALLSDAYERLDDHAADRLEAELFQPAQAAYGLAKRTHAAFADRYGLHAGTFAAQTPAGNPHGAREAIDLAVAALQGADTTLATLQDSMLPVEVGDPELRGGLSGVRELIGTLARRARELERVLGR